MCSQAAIALGIDSADGLLAAPDSWDAAAFLSTPKISTPAPRILKNSRRSKAKWYAEGAESSYLSISITVSGTFSSASSRVFSETGSRDVGRSRLSLIAGAPWKTSRLFEWRRQCVDRLRIDKCFPA